MMRSDSFNWSVAVTLSLLLYGTIFFQRGAQMGIESSADVSSPLITRLTFNQISQPVPDVIPVMDKPKLVPVVSEKIRASKQIEKTQIAKKIANPPQVKAVEVSSSSDGLLQKKREHYLRKLLSHIESFKFYPRAARKRSIEGDVRISFVLNGDGNCEQLTLDGERRVLVNATRAALEAAVPLPIPDEDINFSRNIEFTMVYSLAE